MSVGTLAVLAPLAWPDGAQAEECDDPFTTDLVVDEQVVGAVEVCNDEADLTVTYLADEGWCLIRTRLDVADTLSAIPQTRRGRPLPARFAYQASLDPCIDRFGVQLSLRDWPSGTELFLAANARVREDEGRRRREAWGAGTPFPRGEGTSYFTYTVVAPGSCSLPGGSCTVFVTSTLSDGGFAMDEADGPLAFADAACNAVAEAAGLGGTYKAWLSDAAESPETRFIKASVPYLLVDGTQIADDWTDLTDGDLDAPINLNENGASASARTWTGTRVNGTAAAQRCGEWTSTGSQGVFGTTASTASPWTGASGGTSVTTACTSSYAFYCFQQ
ncbi:MAG: hypothetical protein AAF637_23370 [Pseudomonadota bacterium]